VNVVDEPKEDNDYGPPWDGPDRVDVEFSIVFQDTLNRFTITTDGAGGEAVLIYAEDWNDDRLRDEPAAKKACCYLDFEQALDVFKRAIHHIEPLAKQLALERKEREGT
jgi:hypothetical protein